jgi:hypothetical protein
VDQGHALRLRKDPMAAVLPSDPLSGEDQNAIE